MWTWRVVAADEVFAQLTERAAKIEESAGDER